MRYSWFEIATAAAPCDHAAYNRQMKHAVSGRKSRA